MSFMDFIKHPTLHHILLVLALLGIAGLIIIPDAASKVVLFGVGIVLLSAGLSHIVRKILFSYINGKELFTKVLDNSIACAIVLCGLIYLSCTIITALVALLR